ncbi:TetR family transcriptional regulator [Paenibacillus riograndensis]|uniref:TetR family transcriptional regulator n=1 Tax=Paenibacillus riograndensis TaxID=483937 RepID=A0A132TVU9_9BACL|nr:TetR/AcrR family transcriptional regulator [Paenibacillus riograndensis]KWX75266.1 TetR family transcriptional regulator [Paenibacillus riograndensis]
MEKNNADEQQGQEEWISELLAISEEEKMTPKQLAILQAGIEIFSEKGYAAAATSEIAQRAGVAEGTIFRYYKTKKDLLLSIVSPAMTKMIAPFVLRNFDGVLDVPFDSYEAFMRAFMVNRLEFARKNFKILRIFVQEIPFQPALREQFIENVIGKVLERVTAITEHFKAKGEVIDAPTPSIIRFTISSVIGYLLARLLLLPDKDWDDAAEINLTLDFMLHGIAGPALRREE